MVSRGFFFLILGFVVSCSTLPEPFPVNPDQGEMDSLLAIYGESFVTKDLTYLRHFEQDQKGNTLLYGGTVDKFWFGAFGPNRSLIKENLVQLDVEKRFNQPKSLLPGFGHQVMDKLMFEVFTSEKSENSPNTSIARSIVGMSESTYDLYHITDYIYRDDYIYIELATPWKGGYLFEMNGSLGRSGKNYTHYISKDFSESLVWDCRSPQSPGIGVYYFEKDLFVDVVDNGVWGFDYTSCKQWSYNTLDFFGKETCPGCVTSIKLKEQRDGVITLEAKLDQEVRRVEIEYREGKVLLNEKL